MNPITFRSDVRIMPGTAEPRILIDGELLDLFEHYPKDDARLSLPADGGIVGAVLTMDYQGTRLLWRITREAYPADMYHYAVYEAEWPD